ncbi:MAG: OmpA family protein [Methylococcaceae bacterium]
MTRKRYQESQDSRQNQDRWLISYADFITLMFAVFAVLYAMTILEHDKNEASAVVAEILHKSVTEKVATPISYGILVIEPFSLASSLFPTHPINLSRLSNNGSHRSPYTFKTSSQTEPATKDNQLPDPKQLFIIKEQAQIDLIVTQLQQNLAIMIEQGKIHIDKSNWGVSVIIDASILFSPANAKLNDQSQLILESIASVLKHHAHKIRVEGYTDDKPINTSMYSSNWELSSARACGVVRFLIEQGIEDNRLAATGYAGTHPIADNNLSAGRMQNRRVQLMILANSSNQLDPLINGLNR